MRSRDRCSRAGREQAGIVYSLAYGDQPALICEMVDWARTAGFEVVAAGKGTKYLPAYHASTPDTVWPHYGSDRGRREAGGLNAQMFNSFLDGTKSAIEMAAVANATGLAPAPDGLAFPPCGVDDLPRVLRPRADGGTLHHAGQVEVVSSLERDGAAGVPRPALGRLRHVPRRRRRTCERCFREYGLLDRRQRPLHGDVQAVSPDRPRARHQRRVGRVAPRADRRRARAGTATSSRRRSATCARARRSTAKAATRCTAS